MSDRPRKYEGLMSAAAMVEAGLVPTDTSAARAYPERALVRMVQIGALTPAQARTCGLLGDAEFDPRMALADRARGAVYSAGVSAHVTDDAAQALVDELIADGWTPPEVP